MLQLLLFGESMPTIIS